MNARLRLHAEPGDAPVPDRLHFTSELLSAAKAATIRAPLSPVSRNAVRPSVSPHAPTMSISASIDGTLDEMQRRLDALKDEVENYRFPSMGDDLPPAA